MTVIIGVGFVAKEPIPYSGTGWKRVEEQESCLAGVFCLQDRRDKKETVFLRGGVGGVFPEGKMQLRKIHTFIILEFRHAPRALF